MSQENNRRESRFFTGDASELAQIKNRVSLQKFARHNRTKENVRKVVRLVLFLIVAVLFVLLILNVFFRIEAVEIVGSSRYTKEQILSVCGIEEGQSLYSVGGEEMTTLASRLAYIYRARITRKLPDTLVITLTEDTPLYLTELYGEYFVLSEELRVLDRVFDRSALDGMGLVELVLPEIDSVIVGSYVEFAAEISERYVKEYLDAMLKNELYGRITAFDLRDRFNVSMICSDIYLVELGNGDELGTKMTAVSGMLESEVFSDGIPAKIDANDPSECPVIKSADMVIAFERKK